MRTSWAQSANKSAIIRQLPLGFEVRVCNARAHTSIAHTHTDETLFIYCTRESPERSLKPRYCAAICIFHAPATADRSMRGGTQKVSFSLALIVYGWQIIHERTGST